MPDGIGIVENGAMFGPLMAKMLKVYLQVLGPSKSEPPCKTMPDGTGIVDNGALFGQFMPKT